MGERLQAVLAAAKSRAARACESLEGVQRSSTRSTFSKSGSTSSMTLDETADSQLMIPRRDARARKEQGSLPKPVVTTPRTKVTMPSPPPPSSPNNTEADSDFVDEGYEEAEEEEPVYDEEVTAPPVPETPEQIASKKPKKATQPSVPAAPWDKSHGFRGKSAAKSQPLKPKQVEGTGLKSTSPKNKANTDAFKALGHGVKVETPAKEEQPTHPVQDALNRATTAEKLADQQDEGETKGKKVKKPRDKVVHARKMRFYRSLDSGNSPVEVHDMANAARSGSSKTQKMQTLYESWLASNEDWNRSSLVISIRQTTERKRGSRRWFTRDELAAKYNKDYGVADEIINEKCKDETTKAQCCRPHPDAPSNRSLTQFLCYDEATESTEEDSVLTALLECRDDTRAKGKKSKKDKKRKRSSSSSSDASASGSDSTSSVETVSSDSGKKKKKGKKGKSGKKGKKDKKNSKKDKDQKLTKEQKQKKKEKDEKKAEQDRKKEAQKKVAETRSKAKKALTSLQNQIADCAKKEAKAFGHLLQGRMLATRTVSMTKTTWHG